MKKVIKIADVDSLVFAGPEDINIKFIESKFKSKIVLRGDDLFINGLKDEVKKIEMLVQDIIFTLNKREFITTDDINILIHSNGHVENSDLGFSESKDIILYTHKGSVFAKTPGQKKYHQAVLSNDIVFAIGPAGTGKTFQAVASAVSALKNNLVEKIIITRPVVEAGERLGFLPGDLKDKVDPYLTPLYDALHQMLPKNQLKDYMSNNQIEIAPLAYMRGRTLHNSFIILDEAQNSTQMQMKMFLTRIGVTSKAIITGDITQIDLNGNEISGLKDALKVLNTIKGICFIKLTDKDVVRHKLVKEIIKAYDKEEEDHE